jgi:hypothetical protein
MNAQVSKTLGKKNPFDIYAGGENLTNYYQKNAIIAATQPFSQYFDASMIWGPLTGRMIYAGMRFRIKVIQAFIVLGSLKINLEDTPALNLPSPQMKN